MNFTSPAVGLNPFYLLVCLHHTFIVNNLILRCSAGSHRDNIVKLNYRVRLGVNLDIADSISFYFNLGKGHYFGRRANQHFFDIACFFLMNRVNPAIVN